MACQQQTQTTDTKKKKKKKNQTAYRRINTVGIMTAQCGRSQITRYISNIDVRMRIVVVVVIRVTDDDDDDVFAKKLNNSVCSTSMLAFLRHDKRIDVVQ
jgi:hypothetical protein